MDHTPFIGAAYAVFFIVLLVDALAPVLARHRLVKRLRSRFVREQRRQA